MPSRSIGAAQLKRNTFGGRLQPTKRTFVMVTADFHPHHAALLNIDMQHFFVEGASDGHIVLERINRLAAVCRRAGVTVIHTTTGLSADMPHASRAAALHHNLVIDASDIIFAKTQFSAFYDSALERILRTRH